jgi:hypothetical protein
MATDREGAITIVSQAAKNLAKTPTRMTIGEEQQPTMDMTSNGKAKFGRQADSMRHLKTKAIGAIVVFLAAAAFGGGLKVDLQKAESRYERDSERSEPAARRQFVKELRRIRAKARANHKFRIVSLVDSQIKDLLEQKAPIKEQAGETQDLLLRFPIRPNPVPGKPGFVFSPFGNGEHYIDVRGFRTGTEVNDPYTGWPLLVP